MLRCAFGCVFVYFTQTQTDGDTFCDVQDLNGSIQCYVARDSVGEKPYADFKKYDVGDILSISGEVFKTKTGEISVYTSSVTLLSKSLQILPEKFHWLTDTDAFSSSFLFYQYRSGICFSSR